MRDRALFDLAIDSKLRGCDLVKMRIGTLVTGHEIRTRAMVVQQKTGRPVQFEITTEVRASLLAWLQRRGGTVDDYAFPSRVDHASPSLRGLPRLMLKMPAVRGTLCALAANRHASIGLFEANDDARVTLHRPKAAAEDVGGRLNLEYQAVET